MNENDATTHHEVVELLPWHVTHRLSAEESKLVEDHLAGCVDCREDAEELRALEAAVVASNEELPRPATNLMARVLDRIDAFEREQTNKGIEPRWNFWRWLGQPKLALAQLIILILLVSATVISLVRANRFESLAAREQQRAETLTAQLTDEQKRYRTLVETGTETQRTVARLNIILQPEASEKQIRELLSSINASFAQGPSALGVYVITIPVAEGSTRQATQDAALKVLRSKPRIIAFAESKPE